MKRFFLPLMLLLVPSLAFAGSPGYYTSAVVVTPSDAVVFSKTAALFVGSASTLVVVMDNGNTVTFTSVPAGTLLPVAVRTVKLTGTTIGTAGTLIALR